MNLARSIIPGGETVVATLVIAAASVALVASSGLEARYKLAALLAVAGSVFLAARPDRRIACVVLWILIHPIGIEKIIPIDAAEAPQFMNPSLAINASDGPLFLLVLFLIGETVTTGRIAFRWTRMATVSSLLFVWSVVSYIAHAHDLGDSFVTSSPLALLQDVRLSVFIVLVQSAVRSRGDVIVALLAVLLAVLIQTLIVGLTYVTGHPFSYAAAAASANGADVALQTYSSSGSSDLVRASGTVGQTNEQALFHVCMTLPIVALFAARNRIVRALALSVLAMSAGAILLTFSRGAWLAFPLGLLICGAIAWRRKLLGRKSLLVGAVSMVVGAALLAVLAQPIYERLTYGDSGATDSRLRMLRLATDLFELHPLFGVGPGEFAEAALRVYPVRFTASAWVVPGEVLPILPPVVGRVDIVPIKQDGHVFLRPLPVHNKYMLVLSELGLPGLVLWIWLYVEFIRAGWRCSNLPDPVLRLLGITGIGLGGAEMIYMMVDLFHEDKPLEILFFGPALVGAAARLAPRRASRPMRHGFSSIGDPMAVQPNALRIGR